MKPAFFALILASTVAVPVQAAPPAPQGHSCGCVAQTPGAAVDPANLELARVLVSTITLRKDAKEEFNASFLRTVDIDRVADAGLRDSLSTELASLIVKIDPIVERHLDRIQEVEAMAYARKFTPAELKATTAFASTPEGRNVLSLIYEIPYDQDAMEERSLLMAEVAPDLEDFRVAFCKRQSAARVAAGDKKQNARWHSVTRRIEFDPDVLGHPRTQGDGVRREPAPHR
jgi:hypothetical protein